MSAAIRDLLAEARSAPLEELLDHAWGLRRRHFPDRLVVSAPGNKRYRAGSLCNSRACFPAVSVTGTACALECDHCGRQLLAHMVPAGSPEEFARLVEDMAGRGAGGLLVSGGCTPEGVVPLGPYLGALGRAAERGLRVVVHTGLADRALARALRAAGVAQVLLDLIGADETVRRVYHLRKGAADYRRALEDLLAEGLEVVPHIVVGLDHGVIRGEYEALSWVAELRPAALVVVMLSPLPGTRMAGVLPPAPQEVGRLVAAARVAAPALPVALGCARPAGPRGAEAERLAVDAGANALAFAAPGTLEHAAARGLEVEFRAECCSLPPYS